MCRRSRPSMISVRCAVELAAAARERGRRGRASRSASRTIARASSRSSLGKRGFGARAQLLDRGEADEPGDFACADDQERERRERGERQRRSVPSHVGARVEVLDQPRGREADAERDEAAERGPEHRAPGKAPRRRKRRARPAPADRNPPARDDAHGAARRRARPLRPRRSRAGRRGGMPRACGVMRGGLRAGIAAHGRGGCGAGWVRPSGLARSRGGRKRRKR